MVRRRLFVDVRPLRESPAFRRLWLGTGLSGFGSQLTTFAVVLQVFTLTHSSLAVGAVGLASAVPAIAFGLLGGSIADVVDRRVLVLVASTCLAGVSGLFAVQAFAELNQVWLLYCLIAVQSLLSALNTPARRTFMPRLLPAEQVPAGAALTMFVQYVAITAGPAVAGLIAAGWGLKVCYLIDVVTFFGALYGTVRLPAMRPDNTGSIARPGLRATLDGLRFILRNQVLAGALLADLNATVLGMPIALFPAINAARFGGGAQTLGLLSAAVAVGGLLGSGLSGPVGQVARQGRAMLVAGAAWGACVAGFGLASSLWLSLLMLVLAGAADSISVVFRTTLVQNATPDRYRGRVSGAEYVVGIACPQLGGFRAGAIGSLTTPAISAVGGGLATIVGSTVIGLVLPVFNHYRAQTSQAANEPETASPVN